MRLLAHPFRDGLHLDVDLFLGRAQVLVYLVQFVRRGEDEHFRGGHYVLVTVVSTGGQCVRVQISVRCRTRKSAVHTRRWYVTRDYPVDTTVSDVAARSEK